MTKRRAIRVPEKVVEKGVIALFGSLGWVVNKNSQYSAPIGITPGTADLYVQAEDINLAFWFETKAEDGRQSLRQAEFMQRCRQTDNIYVVGTLDAAYDIVEFLEVGHRRGALGLVVEQPPYRKRYVFAPADQWYRSLAFTSSLERHGYRATKPRVRRRAP